LPGFHCQRFLQDGVGPIDELEPVRGWGRGEEMAAHLREKMARHLDARALRERRGEPDHEPVVEQRPLAVYDRLMA
jgi:hypothetical protein